ncbi:MAG TPA: anthrone oxygenase family protein [Dongiaceae bacterium]|nr:anthrone oxygenase family protein [Dongiaceae bacterium]
MDTLYVAVLVLAATGSGLMAGVFFAFSNFVMAALTRIAPAEGTRAMQAINVTVLNGTFLTIFLGTGVVSVLAMAVAVLRKDGSGTLCTLLGGAVYLLGSILVTMRGNVPLNDALAAVDPATQDGTRRWSKYVRGWTRWNHVRTVACIAAMVLFISALSQ